MIDKEVEIKLNRLTKWIQELFRSTVVDAQPANGDLFQHIYKEVFELCTLEKEQQTYSTIVKTLKAETAMAKRLTKQPIKILRQYMNESFRQQLHRTSLLLQRKGVPSDLWLKIAAMAMNIELPWAIHAVLAATEYLNRFWLPNQRNILGQNQGFEWLELATLISGEQEVTIETRQFINVDMLFGTTPLHFENVPTRLSVYFSNFAKFCHNQRFKLDIGSDDWCGPATNHLILHLADPDKKVDFTEINTSAILFQLTLKGNFYGLNEILSEAARALGNMIRGRDIEQLREQFGVVNNVDEEEYFL